MPIRDELHAFARDCDEVLYRALIDESLTREEAALIQYYCLELLAKIAPLLSESEQ